MSGDKSGGLVEEAAEALTRGPVGRRLRKWVWTNAFPMLCGLIVTGAAGWVGHMSNAVQSLSDRVAEHDLESTHRQKWAQEAIQREAAEIVALRRLLEEAQIALGIVAYKVDWYHPPSPLPNAPGQEPRPPLIIDTDALAKALTDRLGKTAKVHPDDVGHLLHQQYQNQMPLIPEQATKGGG